MDKKKNKKTFNKLHTEKSIIRYFDFLLGKFSDTKILT